MRSDLRSLEWLLAIVDQGSIGAAARHLHVSQPSVTDRLQRLERHLGLTLLQRSPRGTRVTHEGAVVADWARHVLDASDRLEAGAAALRRHHHSQLRVAASMTVAEYLLPGWLAHLRATAPNASVALTMHNSRDVIHLARKGEVDLGFVEGPHVDADLSTIVVAQDDLVVVVGAGHPWAGWETPISITELLAQPLVIREPGSGTRETLELALERAGHDLQAAERLELGSTAAIKATVHAGQGAGILSRLAVATDLSSGQLHEVLVTELDLTRWLHLVHSPDHPLTGAPAELAAIALTWAREHARTR